MGKMHFHLGYNVTAIGMGGQNHRKGKPKCLLSDLSVLKYVEDGGEKEDKGKVHMPGTQILVLVPPPPLYSLIPSL